MLLFLSSILLIYLGSVLSIRRRLNEPDSIQNHCERPYNSSMYYPRVQSNCPASNLVNMRIDGLEAYPMDIFDQEQFLEIKSKNPSPFENKDVFRCNANIPPWPFDQHYYACSALTRCSIMQQNIDTFMIKANKWKTKHNLCHFRNSIGSVTSDINVIILGGSVTSGAGAVHCFCDPDLDSKCTISTFVNIQAQYHEFNGDRCRWSEVLQRWLKSVGNPKVNVINLSSSGYNSLMMSEEIMSFFKRHSIPKLRKQDIVLIDHSVNDALSLGRSKSEINILYEALNSLIMKIFELSDVQSLPSIIITETYPYVNGRDIPGKSKLDYSSVYELISKKYLIPIWSMKEVVWSDIADTLMYPYINILRFNCQPDQHPGNSYHLYYADIIAASLITEMEKCRVDKVISDANSRSNVEMTLTTFASKQELSVLVCDEEKEDMLYFSALEISQDTSTPSSNTIVINPQQSWELIDESKKRVGWISQDSKDESAMNSNEICKTNNIIEVVGSKTYAYASIISFPLNAELFRRVNSILEIEYLRTYHNGGIADIFLCNKYIATIDGIWKDYEHYKYSLPQKFSIHFDLNSSNGFCRDEDSKENYNLEIKRRCSSKDENKEVMEARDRQKIKIIKTRICQEKIEV